VKDQPKAFRQIMDLRRQTLIKLLAGGIVLSAFGFVVLITDILISEKIRQTTAQSTASLPAPLRKAALEGKTKAYGSYITEGSLTSDIIKEHRHHDATDYTSSTKNPESSIWIFGDSWGGGIKQQEINDQTISKNLKQPHSLRIIGVSSHSPLLMNLAYRARLKEANKNPDFVVLFIDQTDIGDDFCRYRPYTIRSKDGNLLGVTRNNQLDLRGGATLNAYHKSLGNWNSGLSYLAKTRLNNWLAETMGIPGITDCNYDDLLAFQQGKEFSPNGSKTTDYEDYLISNTENLLSEILTNNPRTKIILMSHDWAQHSLKQDHPDYLPKNIRDTLSKVQINDARNIILSHIRTDSYPKNKDSNQIYRYPADQFSHPNDYTHISQKIASLINSLSLKAQ